MSFSLLFISQFSSTICCKFYCVSGFKTPHLTHDRRGRGVADLCDTSVNYSGVSMLAGSGFLSAATRQLSHSKTMSASHKDSIQSSKVFMAFLIIFSDGKSTILQLLALQVMISYIAQCFFLKNMQIMPLANAKVPHIISQSLANQQNCCHVFMGKNFDPQHLLYKQQHPGHIVLHVSFICSISANSTS